MRTTGVGTHIHAYHRCGYICMYMCTTGVGTYVHAHHRCGYICTCVPQVWVHMYMRTTGVGTYVHAYHRCGYICTCIPQVYVHICTLDQHTAVLHWTFTLPLSHPSTNRQPTTGASSLADNPPPPTPSLNKFLKVTWPSSSSRCYWCSTRACMP